MSYLLNSRYNNCLDFDEAYYREIMRDFPETEWQEHAEGKLLDVPLEALYVKMVELLDKAEEEDGPNFWHVLNCEASCQYRAMYDLAAYIIVSMVEDEFPGFFWSWDNDRSNPYTFIGCGNHVPHPMFLRDAEWKSWVLSEIKQEISDNERYFERDGYLPEEVYIANEQLKRLVANH